jgi:hypothetical protein
LAELFKSDPELTQIIQEASQLQPEQQAQIIQRIVEQFIGGGQ